jgi:tRNA threonylcarbamoyladenosine biosynthesis protein TsaE
MPLEFISRSPEQTAALAVGLSRLLKPGDVVFLIGQLGAGKTFFIQCAAAGLGVSEPVTSPSFTMAQTYSGETTVHHLDLYRLAKFTREDAIDFEPFFESDAITFVEWPEQAEAFLEKPDVVVRLEHLDINSRRIFFTSRRNELQQGLEQLVAGAGH